MQISVIVLIYANVKYYLFLLVDMVFCFTFAVSNKLNDMKRLLLGVTLMYGAIGLGQNYSGSVYVKKNSQNGIRKWIRYYPDSGLDGLIKIGNIYWSPTNAQCPYNGNFGNEARSEDWSNLLGLMGVNLDVYNNYISTDPNNPTKINISPNSDLLKILNLGDYVWIPKTYNEPFELHFKVNENLGVNDIKDKSIVSIYPNPTTDKLNIDIDNDVNIKVFDVFGKLVIDRNVNKEIGLTGLDKGLYLIQVSNDDICYKTKIIKI